MKNRIFLLLIPAFCLSACEKVIDLDLNDAATQLVIQGEVTDQPGPYFVTLEQSVPFDEPGHYPTVSGAFVVITDGSVSDTLQEVQSGVYATVHLPQGQPGKTYTLTVTTTDGQVYTAQSSLPVVVPFDDLTTTTVTKPNGDTNVKMVLHFTDPPGLGNYYRFVQWTNGRRVAKTFVLDDRNSDGIAVSRNLFGPGNDVNNASGDTVTVEMQTVDRVTYRYFYALNASNDSGPNATTPANPDNNFGGACLGYFSAHTVQRKTLVVE